MQPYPKFEFGHRLCCLFSLVLVGGIPVLHCREVCQVRTYSIDCQLDFQLDFQNFPSKVKTGSLSKLATDTTSLHIFLIPARPRQMYSFTERYHVLSKRATQRTLLAERGQQNACPKEVHACDSPHLASSNICTYNCATTVTYSTVLFFFRPTAASSAVLNAEGKDSDKVLRISPSVVSVPNS